MGNNNSRTDKNKPKQNRAKKSNPKSKPKRTTNRNATAKRRATKTNTNVSIDTDRIVEILLGMEDGYYLDLDTMRKNKESTKNRKSPSYVSEIYRFFSDNKTLYTRTVICISRYNREVDDTSRKVPEHTEYVDRLGEEQRDLRQQINSTPRVTSTAMPKIANPRPSSRPNPKRNNRGKDPDKKPKNKGKNKANANVKTKDKDKSTKNKRDPIPPEVRFNVWETWCHGRTRGSCFCCDAEISYLNWHCGHILAHARGGSIDEGNLRPVCRKCNLDMGAKHMYEYIYYNDMVGQKHLRHQSKVCVFYKSLSDSIHNTNELLDELYTSKKINKTTMNKYKRAIISKRKTERERIGIIEEIHRI
jgi:hypothetical protein